MTIEVVVEQFRANFMVVPTVWNVQAGAAPAPGAPTARIENPNNAAATHADIRRTMDIASRRGLPVTESLRSATRCVNLRRGLLDDQPGTDAGTAGVQPLVSAAPRGARRSEGDGMGSSRWVTLGIATASLVLGAGCGSNATISRTSRRSEVDKTTLPPNGRPTAAALAAIDAVQIARVGSDCGGGRLDGGYPTTTVGGPTTCLRDADRSGVRAFMRFTGRTYTSGAYRVDYAADGRGGLRIDVVVADQNGRLHREGWACRVPQQPLHVGATFPDRRVEPSLGDPPCRHLAT
jgi:hypothetical protein